ncbi:MAG: HupE/UreJ family protein [Myxococcales bacterium]|nr:HupE/UreJ family protein [Myxococcales bacterium]
MTRSISLRRALPPATAAVLGLGLCLASSDASAHAGSSKRIQAELYETGASLHVEVDAVDAAVALGLGLSIEPGELDPHAALVSSWLGRGLRVDGESGPCAVSPTQPELRGEGPDATVVLELDYACPAPMGTVRLHDDTIFDEDPAHEAFVSVRRDDAVEAHVLRADARSVVLGRTPRARETAAAFLLEGGRHLVTGYDHMLFLLSLILGAGLLVRREGLRPALRDVAWVVTAFTLGHSLSLAAAALGVVALPGTAVEIAIAASIVLVALGNVLRPQQRVARPWLAAAFGLVHGFGFSSVLGELGLPTAHRVLALLSFNLGIELAQLAFVAAVLLPLASLSRLRGYQRYVLQTGSLAIAAFGGLWLVERSLGL